MMGKKEVMQAHSSGGGLYFFGMIGALIYYIQVANGFWGVVLAFLKAFVWPGFFVYDVLKFVS